MLGDRHGDSSAHAVRSAVTLATIRGELTTGRMAAFAPNAIDHKL